MDKNMEIRGIIPVSVPFCIGVGIGGHVHFSALTAYSWITAGAAMAGAAACLVAAARTRKGAAMPIALMFMLLGLTRALSHSLAENATEASWNLAQSCMERFRTAIGKIPFEDGKTTAILQALLTGDRSGLDSETVKAFRDAGAAHILALSGLHLGIIYGIAAKVLSVLGNSRPSKVVRAVSGIALAGFYTAMTGAGPSIQRAFLFIAMNESLRLCPGRKRVPVNILCTALTIQLCIDPSVIRSFGFQLSYLSMTGIMTVFPVLEKWYPEGKGKNPVRAIWVSAALSISCQIFTAPLVLIRFGTFPKYFLLTNLIALPLTEILIVSGLAATALTAAGICPEILVGFTGKVCGAMVFALGTISSM